MVKSHVFGAGLFLLAAFGLSWSLYNQYTPKPPNGRLATVEDKVVMESGTYSWERWGRSATANFLGDPTGVVRDNEPLIVETTDTLEFTFDSVPASIDCYLWEMDTGEVVYSGGLNERTLQFEQWNVSPGDYAIEVRAKWAEGYVLYHARILVPE
ncbi:hypothetical protein [Mesobacillus harenae]|uniref:hypothetical protein n=1 Tax=Mesobacillus harenae TaxID=2213203 RepID=UPI0015801FB9|nr:hypothetical protein [Mesobacillus harenae]